MTIEDQLKDVILSRYKSVKAFASACGIVYSTLDSVLKRGLMNSNAGTVIKIFKTLDLDVESISTGVLSPIEKRIITCTLPEITHLEKCRKLDEFGKKAVNAVLDVELCRIQAQGQRLAAFGGDSPEVSAITGALPDQDSNV